MQNKPQLRRCPYPARVRAVCVQLCGLLPARQNRWGQGASPVLTPDQSKMTAGLSFLSVPWGWTDCASILSLYQGFWAHIRLVLLYPKPSSSSLLSGSPLLFFFLTLPLFICPRLNSLTHSGAPLLLFRGCHGVRSREGYLCACLFVCWGASSKYHRAWVQCLWPASSALSPSLHVIFIIQLPS